MLNPIKIRFPIWGSRSVGVATYKIPTSGYLYIEIMYVSKKDGERAYPDVYRIDVSRLKGYPTKTIRNNLILVLIPINDLEIAEKRGKEKTWQQ